MEKTSHFDVKAATWDAEPRRRKLAREVAEGINSAVHPTKEMNALDFGCGTGYLTLFLQPHLRQIDGLDNSRGMLEVFEKKIREQRLPNVRAMYCDVESGERPEGKYHLVVSSMTLHHVRKPRVLFRLFFDLLHPGGKLCFADLDLEDGSYHDDKTGIFHFGFDRAELRRALEETGFRQVLDRTAAEVTKAPAGAVSRTYTVFLICATKPL